MAEYVLSVNPREYQGQQPLHNSVAHSTLFNTLHRIGWGAFLGVREDNLVTWLTVIVERIREERWLNLHLAE